MSFSFKIKVFVNHKHVGWLRQGVGAVSLVLHHRSATKFSSSLPSIYGETMAALEQPEDVKGTPQPVTFQFIRV